MDSVEYICIRCQVDDYYDNPSMEEEIYCVYCMKESRMNLCALLIQGQPGCLECFKRITEGGESVTKFHKYNQSLKKSNTVFNASNDIEDNLLNVSKNSIDDIDITGSKHQRARTKLQFDIGLLEKSESDIAVNKGQNLDNKFMKLFSPKTGTTLKFSTRHKSLAQNIFDRLTGSLEVLLKNTNNFSINLPVIYEANRNEKKSLDTLTLSTLDNGNYLFLFLDDKNELLYGKVMNSVGGKNSSKFFKKIKNSKNIDYSEVLEGIAFDPEKNVIKHTGFLFNLSSYNFACNSMKLMSFLCYKKDKINVMLYNNIFSIKIYDMC
jgi:hypothetical protein